MRKKIEVAGRFSGGEAANADTVDGYHMPETCAHLLSDHNVSAHNALAITPGYHPHNASEVTGGTKTLAFISDHNVSAHNTLGINADKVDNVDLPGLMSVILSDHNQSAHVGLGLSVLGPLNASWIASGTLSISRLPTFNASQTTAGIFDLSLIPPMNASWIDAGTKDLSFLSDHNVSAHEAIGIVPLSGHNASFITSGTKDLSFLSDHNLSAHTALGIVPLAAHNASYVNAGQFDVARMSAIPCAGVTGIVSDDLLKELTNTSSTTSTSYIPMTNNITVPSGFGSSTFRVYFELGRNSASGSGYGRIYVNASAIGTERINDGSVLLPSYMNFSEAISLTGGDTIAVYAKQNTGIGTYIQNLRVYGKFVTYADLNFSW